MTSYRGSRNLSKQIELLDSIVVNADSVSGRGNFFMQDSSIYFADMYYASIFQYKAIDGTFLSRHFGLGQGPNELSPFLYVYPFRNKHGENFIVDSSINIYIYKEHEYFLERKGQINFGWDKVHKDNYDSPSIYNVMEMTDFGIDFTYLNDSTLLIPVNIINRYLNNIDSKRYSKGHILAELNLTNMQVERVVGRFPTIYEQKPTPFFEFFQYALQNDTLYVSHSVDSLIYVYKYPDELLYTIGNEASHVNRNYTIGYDSDFSHFKKDIKEVGANTGLMYIKEENLLFRTILRSFDSKQVYLQAYSGTELVLEANMPDFFKLLGYFDGYIYGVKMIPTETEDGHINFVFYRFKVG